MVSVNVSINFKIEFCSGAPKSKTKFSAKPGRVCYANDETYETGENFFPNCKTECICVDGVIGCRKAQDPAHCEGETIMAMAAHTKPIDMVEVRPANEDKNIAGKFELSLG